MLLKHQGLQFFIVFADTGHPPKHFNLTISDAPFAVLWYIDYMTEAVSWNGPSFLGFVLLCLCLFSIKLGLLCIKKQQIQKESLKNRTEIFNLKREKK